jgi:hypothetical protein
MTLVEHKCNPETGEYEVSAVISDSLGLYGKPTINVTGHPLYTPGLGLAKKIGFEDKTPERRQSY